MESRGLVLFTLASIVGANGCASIISGRTAQVKIDSNPRHANVSVRDHEGSEVASATTPATVSLKRGRTWLRPAKYTATISKPGYETAQAPIKYTLNPWVFGNIAVGGVVGLAVDGTTGAGWKPKPNEIAVRLEPIEDPDADPSIEPLGEATELTSAEMPVKKPLRPKPKGVPHVARGGRKTAAR